MGRRDAHRRERREIVAVDQIVRDARMVRLLFCFLIQNRGGFQLLGIVLVIEVDCAVERERIKDRRFRVLQVVLVQALHRLVIKLGAGLLVDLVVIFVKNFDGAEVFGLARRLGFGGLALLDRFPPCFQVGSRERWYERIGQFAHRQAPIGHRAVRILLDNCLKGLHCLGVEEIVQ